MARYLVQFFRRQQRLRFLASKKHFISKQNNSDRIRRRKRRIKRTQMCQQLNKNCKQYPSILRRCPYAHTFEQLVLINYYNKNKNYKEIQCKEGNQCNNKNCQFYHTEEEKRFNITMKRLSSEAQTNPKESWFIKKGWLKVSEALPSLSYFTEKETQQFTDRIVELINRENLKTNGAVSGVELNLVQRSSNISNQEKWRLIRAMKDCQDIFFKSKEISYVRIGKKRQFTFIINDRQFVDEVCNEIKERNPAELKLIVKSVGNDWGKMSILLEAIQASKGSLCKLELDIREMIGSIDLSKLEMSLRENILPLNNLKCIKLRLEFGYIEYNGSYEKKTIEIALDLLKIMHNKSSSRLDISLSMFGLTVANKGRSLEIKTDPISHQSERLRKKLNKRLSCWVLYCHLIKHFSKLFLKTTKPERMILDFSYIYGLSPNKDQQRSILANKYETNIRELLSELSEVLVRIRNESLLQFSLKFFAFDFKFQSDLKKKVSFYKFKGMCLLPDQNKPVSTFENFENLAKLIHSKLNLQFQYDILKGNLFVSEKLLQTYQQQSEQDAQIVSMKKGNATFLECMMGNYNSLKKIECSINETPQIIALIQEKQRILPVIFEKEPKELDTMFGKIIKINSIMSLFQSRLLLILRAFAKTRNLHPTFSFRHEVLFQILKMLRLNYKGISNILLNYRKEQQEKERLKKEQKEERNRRFWGRRWEYPQEILNEQVVFEATDKKIEIEKEDQVEVEEEEIENRIEGWN